MARRTEPRAMPCSCCSEVSEGTSCGRQSRSSAIWLPTWAARGAPLPGGAGGGRAGGGAAVDRRRARRTPRIAPVVTHRRLTQPITVPATAKEELARLRREKAELVKQHAKEKAAWEKERTELEDERDFLKRSVVLCVKEAMGR